MSVHPSSSLPASSPAALRRQAGKHYFTHMALGVDAVVAYIESLVDAKRWRQWYQKPRRRMAARVMRRRTRPIKRDGVKKRLASVIASLNLILPEGFSLPQSHVKVLDGWSILSERICFHRWLNSNRGLFRDRKANWSLVLHIYAYAMLHSEKYHFLATSEGMARFKSFVEAELEAKYLDRHHDASMRACYDQEKQALWAIHQWYKQVQQTASWQSVWDGIAAQVFMDQNFVHASLDRAYQSNRPVSSAELNAQSTRAKPVYRGLSREDGHSEAAAYSTQGRDRTPLSTWGMFSHPGESTFPHASPDLTPESDPDLFIQGNSRTVNPHNLTPEQIRQTRNRAMYRESFRTARDMLDNPLKEPYVAVGEGDNVQVFTAPMPLWSPFLVRHLKRDPSPHVAPYAPTFWFHGGEGASIKNVCDQIKTKLDKLPEPPNCLHILHNNRHIELTQLHVYRTFLSKQEYSQLDELRRILNITNEIRSRAIPSMAPA